MREALYASLFFFMSRAVIFLMMMLSVLWVPHVSAALSLSANPYEGGASLRFGRVDVTALENKEVTLRVTSTDGKQYQVFQRIIEPFINEQGETLDPSGFTSFSLLGSNMLGTLYQGEPMRLGYVDQLIYTSNPSGDSDSFIIAYQLCPESFNITGKFFGKIIYTVRFVDGSSESTSIIDVYGEAPNEGFSVTVSGSSGKNSIHLDPGSIAEQAAYAEISYEGNFGREMKIYQEVLQFPQDEFQDEADRGCFDFFTTGGENGTPYCQSPSSLNRGQVLLYTSRSARDTVYVNFAGVPEYLNIQKAGVYQGILRYTILQGEEPKGEFQIDFTLTIDPIFSMTVTLPPQGLQFKDVLPGSMPQVYEVSVAIETNIKHPYVVSQNLKSPLANEKGEEINSDYFILKTELSEGSRGAAHFETFAPVPLGIAPLFSSDDAGSPAQFTVQYQLKPYTGIISGDYSTVINYTLGEK